MALQGDQTGPAGARRPGRHSPGKDLGPRTIGADPGEFPQASAPRLTDTAARASATRAANSASRVLGQALGRRSLPAMRLGRILDENVHRRRKPRLSEVVASVLGRGRARRVRIFHCAEPGSRLRHPWLRWRPQGALGSRRNGQIQWRQDRLPHSKRSR